MSIEGHRWKTSGASHPSAATHPNRVTTLMLIEVREFAALRRAVGAARADLLALDLAERIAALLPSAIVATAGRNLLELRFDVADQADVTAVLRCLHAGFDSPLMVDGEPHRVALRIGLASAPAADADELVMVERAEQSLACARGDMTGPVRSDVVPAVDDQAVAGELHAAVAREELFLQYQPKLHLRRQQIASVEALIRWQHPSRGLIVPNDFIGVAERTGAIGAITLWTLRRVIADQKALARNDFDLPIFINIAGALLADATFIEAAIDLIRSSGAKLGVEITETSVIRDPEAAIRHLKRLADIGVVVTIDDYGAGLSSLAYLKQLPASELKIDKLFVTQLTSSHRDPLIVRSTIDLAHALEMEVVAEGVETPASLALLSVMGCDMVQGYLISRPLTLEALLPFLRDDRHLALAAHRPSPFERLAAVRSRA